MIRNYLSLAWRNLVRRKAYTAINISGLAIGIAACLLLFSVIRYELSYESFQPNRERIFHIVTQDKYSDGLFYTPGVPFPALEAVRTDFPHITTGALHASYGSQVTVLGNKPGEQEGMNKKFIEQSGVFFADPEFFQVFTYQWLSGNASVLKEPGMTVLSRSMAEKYFGNWQNAVGQYLKLDNTATVKVAGILENVPLNTDFPFGIVTSLETLKANPGTYNYTSDWGSTTSNFQLFMRLPNAVSEKSINQQLAAFSKKHYKESDNERLNFLQPLKEVHFDNRFGNFGDHITSKSSLWTLSLIGVFIIIMACINFINLSTAQAVRRSKEVGVRKVLGSNRLQLFGQMIGETAIIVVAAVIVAVALAMLCMPYIKHIASIQEKLSLFNLPALIFILGITILVTLLSGFYPSLVLSGFNPALALKNKITSASVGGISLRRGLVVLQFAISQVLIIGTIVAISQMNFVQHADLGFNKEAVYVITGNSDSTIVSRQPAFKEKLLQLPGIQSVSFCSDVPSSDNGWSTNFSYDHRPDEKFSLYLKFGDEDYLKTYGLQLIAGRSFSKSDTTREVVINETLMKKLGINNPNEVIGKEIRTGRGAWRSIVGVVKDFKTNSLREEIKPVMLGERRKSYGYVGIKLRSGNLTQLQKDIQKTWDEFYPEYANYSYFLDESINNFYKQEQQLSLLYKIFAGIAIFISCLGLYGLVSFMAAQKTKEIGIRKVLGASISNIIYLFSREFTLLIIVAFVLAVPVAWFMMNNWLENFVFRIHIGAGVFALAILGSIIIAWITVGYRSVKAAIVNPVKSLRSE